VNVLLALFSVVATKNVGPLKGIVATTNTKDEAIEMDVLI